MCILKQFLQSHNQSCTEAFTKEDYFQFVCWTGKSNINVCSKDDDEENHYEDDLSGGAEAGNMQLPQFPDKDGTRAVEECCDDENDAGKEVILLEALLRQLLVENERRLDDKNQT